MSILDRDALNHASDGEVVSLNRFRSGRGLTPIRQAEAYWAALREADEIPLRSRIDPRGLDGLLEYACILERIAPGIARFRLAGQHLTGLAGMEVRGMPLTAFFTPKSRGQIGAVLEQVFDGPSIAEVTLTGEHGPAVEARLLILPLRNDVGQINRALGVLVAEGDEARSPQRFDIVACSLRTVGPEAAMTRRATPVAPPLHGFAEEERQFDAAAPGDSGPHLRLVK
ncbi:PAS domain-containing protein [Pukyongiella litopenaei]|uniref:PAS domain-containing protein n=1 Tax=Pukyongiella litopenaei TaxID=2605946 RepID=A0A2S0MKN7_9RHOB|nr:PAS domain-containing protein [Pukyongiella litopenaei]AVO36440.1 PAS domain-containing protein [Pukyongiella litopenaei]